MLRALGARLERDEPRALLGELRLQRVEHLVARAHLGLLVAHRVREQLALVLEQRRAQVGGADGLRHRRRLLCVRVPHLLASLRLVQQRVALLLQARELSLRRVARCVGGGGARLGEGERLLQRAPLLVRARRLRARIAPPG